MIELINMTNTESKNSSFHSDFTLDLRTKLDQHLSAQKTDISEITKNEVY